MSSRQHIMAIDKAIAAVLRQRKATAAAAPAAAASGGSAPRQSRKRDRPEDDDTPKTAHPRHSEESLAKIEMVLRDWNMLLAHTNEAAASGTWALPPDDLFLRILPQINLSKREILQEKYNACLDPNCPPQTRSVFIRVLKRIAESFMTCLLQMQSGQNGFGQHGGTPGGAAAGAAAAAGGGAPAR